MKHTSGPLAVSHERNKFDSSFDSLTVVTPDGIVVATVNVQPFAPHLDEPIANAHLFAAAPELLEALRECEALLGKYAPTKVSTARMNARLAISKAEGK